MTSADTERCAASRLGAVYVEFDRSDPTVHDVVYLPTDFNPRELFQQAQLAHDIWHYVQCENGMYAALRKSETTLSVIETQAYRIQSMWGKSHGSAEAQAALFAAG